MKRAKAKNITNLVVQESLEQFLSTPVSGNVDFILGEVIEHMELADAASIVRSCLEYPSCNKVIITTPNADFNRHYFDEGMRHPDHKFEFTKNEFMSWLNETVGVQYDVAYLDIGDMVDEISVSVGAVITKRGG
jgi:hypothetical protein